jgi:hypothetical protein
MALVDIDSDIFEAKREENGRLAFRTLRRRRQTLVGELEKHPEGTEGNYVLTALESALLKVALVHY